MSRRGKHTTFIEGLSPILKVLNRHPEIAVSPGKIVTGLPTGAHLIKLKQLSGGVELVFRGTRTKQTLHLYGDGREIEKIVRAQKKVPVL